MKIIKYEMYDSKILNKKNVPTIPLIISSVPDWEDIPNSKIPNESFIYRLEILLLW